MKKTVRVDDLCCERCAKQMATKLAILDGVRAAKADYKRGCIYVEVTDEITDERIRAAFDGTGMTVTSIEIRKGIFG